MNQLQIHQIDFDTVLARIRSNIADNVFVLEFIGDKPDIYCVKDRYVRSLIEDDEDPNTIFVMTYLKSCEVNEEEE
jgi:hypothetical protein